MRCPVHVVIVNLNVECFLNIGDRALRFDVEIILGHLNHRQIMRGQKVLDRVHFLRCRRVSGIELRLRQPFVELTGAFRCLLRQQLAQLVLIVQIQPDRDRNLVAGIG